MEGPEVLEAFEKEESEAFEAYVEAITKEEEEVADPVVYGPNPYYELELKSLHRLAFAVADNPFMKTDTAKYYPEIHVIEADGSVSASIGPNMKLDDKFGSSYYCEGFRDDRLKINDDRKVKLTLSDFEGRHNMMILLTVRMNDVKGVNPEEFKEAWYRLQNEDTNQSIDYVKVEAVKADNGIQDGEEEEAEPAGSENGDEKPTKETIFLAGRLYREDIITKVEPSLQSVEEGEEKPEPEIIVDTKWIYERWNKVVDSETFPNIAQAMGDLLKRSGEELASQQEKVKEAKDVVAQAAAEKKAQLAAAAAKKAKATKKGGKKDEQPAEEEA